MPIDVGIGGGGGCPPKGPAYTVTAEPNTRINVTAIISSLFFIV